jgi:hypothetical protein
MIDNIKQPFKFTSSHTDEVFSRGFVDFNVSVTDVMLVPLDGHVAVGRVLEEDQGLAVASTLVAQAQGNSAPKGKKNKSSLNRNLTFIILK